VDAGNILSSIKKMKLKPANSLSHSKTLMLLNQFHSTNHITELPARRQDKTERYGIFKFCVIKYLTQQITTRIIGEMYGLKELKS
jgi:hypothetical protein